jgi:hypothetical protein
MPAKFPDAEAAALLVASHDAAKASARLASNIATALAVAGDEAGAGMTTRMLADAGWQWGASRMGNRPSPDLKN